MAGAESLPSIASVTPGGAAERAGVQQGDQVVSVNGVVPRDILEWQRLIDDLEVELELLRGGIAIDVVVERSADQPFGAQVSSAVFDRVHTCDNHCEFCFIYQLPKDMRRSLYLKDDDYRLSFLFGNFTTLTRFTEADLERVVDEQLSPLFVSVHSTDVRLRSEMLRNPRGGVSLRWLKALLAHGIKVRAQIVLCPGVNNAERLDETLCGFLDEFPGISSIAVVPLGLSKHNTESRMRVHTEVEAAVDVEIIGKWQKRFMATLGRPVVHASDELYIRAGMDLPSADEYENFEMLEDGVGLARTFLDSFASGVDSHAMYRDGFFAHADVRQPTQYVPANPAGDTGLRAAAVGVSIRRRVAVLGDPVVVTGEYGYSVMAPVIHGRYGSRVRVLRVNNTFFGGNTAVAGLMTFEDISSALATAGEGIFLLPDVCLNEGRFLDGHSIEELQNSFNVEVLPTSGAALRERLDVLTQETANPNHG